MNHPLWGRRKRIKQLVLACLIVALVTVLLPGGSDHRARNGDGTPSWLLSRPAHLR